MNPFKKERHPKTFAEFFAGIGLMRMGLERAGWRLAFANDLDADKRTMYAAQFPDASEHFVLEDIHRLSIDQIPPIGLATASFPCNDLSLAGSRSGLRGRNSSAFWGFIEIMRKMEDRRPPMVLLENVAGFLTSHGGRDFEEAMKALNDLGYGVDPFILNAASFVPQSRVRLFVAGIADQRTETVISGELRSENPLRPPALAEFIHCHPGIRWNLRNPPRPPACDARLEDLLEDLAPDAEEWWSAKRADYLLNQMSPRHRTIADAMMSRREWSYGTVFRRVRKGRSMAELRTNGVAGCLRTPRGGSGRQILFKAGFSRFQVRLLTPRECARLMGADDFRITVRANKALFGFGDAVCVPAIEWIARHCLNPAFAELSPGAFATTKSAIKDFT